MGCSTRLFYLDGRLVNRGKASGHRARNASQRLRGLEGPQDSRTHCLGVVFDVRFEDFEAIFPLLRRNQRGLVRCGGETIRAGIFYHIAYLIGLFK